MGSDSTKKLRRDMIVKTKKAWTCVGLVALSPVAFGQQIVQIDLNDVAGSASGGGIWNSFPTPVDGSALVTTTGAASGWAISDYTLDTNAGQGFLVWGAGTNYASVSGSGTNRGTGISGMGAASWVPAAALDDYFFGGSINGVGMEFSGFDANQTGITVELFPSNSGSRTAMYFVQGFTVGGVSTVDADPLVDFFESNANTSNVLTWTDVTADALGRIFVEADARDASLSGARFNAMRITVVPEPSTYALLFGGLVLGIVLWRRKRS
jgi:hypothetical protein